MPRSTPERTLTLRRTRRQCTAPPDVDAAADDVPLLMVAEIACIRRGLHRKPLAPQRGVTHPRLAPSRSLLPHPAEPPPSRASTLTAHGRAQVEPHSADTPRAHPDPAVRGEQFTILHHHQLKGLSHLVQSCFSRRNCMSKDSARSTGYVGHFFFQKKYCVTCKKSTLKVLSNFGFVTSFEDSHYILQFRYIYGAQLIQWFPYSNHLHVNCCSYQ